jgi:ABC-type sugar transport system ATPase subunit
MFLEIKSLTKQVGDSIAVNNIYLSQEKFQHVVIAGETGSGKSTLLKLIAGLETPDVGSIFFCGEKVQTASETLVAGHPQIAYLPQHFELQKFLRVEQVLEYANRLSKKQADELFSICKIQHLLKRKTNELSGGEKQRIALCRLLIGKPTLLLLDEPFSNLDQILKITLKEVIEVLSTKLKISIILVSHDPDDTLPWGNYFFVLRNGAIVQQGTAKQIYSQPANEYVAGLFGKYSVIRKVFFTKSRVGARANEIVRPENFSISMSPSKKSKRAKVSSIAYYGGYQLLSVEIGSFRVLAVDSIKKSYKINDVVHVTYKQARASA